MGIGGLVRQPGFVLAAALASLAGTGALALDADVMKLLEHRQCGA